MKRHYLYIFHLFYSWKSQIIVISLYKRVIYYPKFVFWSWRKLLKYVVITNISKCRIKILKGKKVRIYALFSNTFWLIAVSFLVFFSKVCCCLSLKMRSNCWQWYVSSFLNFHVWHEMMCHTRKNLASKSGHKNKLGKFNIP